MAIIVSILAILICIPIIDNGCNVAPSNNDE